VLLLLMYSDLILQDLILYQNYQIGYCTKCMKLQISLRLCLQFTAKASKQFVGTRISWRVSLLRFCFYSSACCFTECYIQIRDSYEVGIFICHVRLFCSYSYSAIW
jgi:hypothetical protein